MESGLGTKENRDQKKKRSDANTNREKNTDNHASASAQVDLSVRLVTAAFSSRHCSDPHDNH
jgi:hypothetical protein